MATNLNTCHIWSDPGPMFDAIDNGEEIPPPIWAVQTSLRNSVNRWNLGVNGCQADVQLNLLHGQAAFRDRS